MNQQKNISEKRQQNELPFSTVILFCVFICVVIAFYYHKENQQHSRPTEEKEFLELELQKMVREQHRVVKELQALLAGEFIDIPGGTFSMGNSNGEWTADKPEHVVTIKPFLLGK